MPRSATISVALGSSETMRMAELSQRGQQLHGTW